MLGCPVFAWRLSLNVTYQTDVETADGLQYEVMCSIKAPLRITKDKKTAPSMAPSSKKRLITLLYFGSTNSVQILFIVQIFQYKEFFYFCKLSSFKIKWCFLTLFFKTPSPQTATLINHVLNNHKKLYSTKKLDHYSTTDFGQSPLKLRFFKFLSYSYTKLNEFMKTEVL